ncbi:MAG: NUDIX hydrolase [Candidatus Omnitrophica bacterium]|nr:NUDIX hydrolase [Candidatus Omnitrophota bacterium]
MKKCSKKIVLKEGKFIRFVKKGGWEYIERVNCDGAVVILALTKDRKVLFVEQFRPPVGKKVIEFPAGLINDCPKRKSKESIISAAKRELLEETGYKAKRIIKVLEGPASSGTSSDVLTLVRAVDIEKVSSGGGDEGESIIVHEVKLDKAESWLKQMKNKGFLIGTRIYAGLYFLNKYNGAK